MRLHAPLSSVRDRYGVTHLVGWVFNRGGGSGQVLACEPDLLLPGPLRELLQTYQQGKVTCLSCLSM